MKNFNVWAYDVVACFLFFGGGFIFGATLLHGCLTTPGIFHVVGVAIAALNAAVGIIAWQESRMCVVAPSMPQIVHSEATQPTIPARLAGGIR